MRDKSYWVYIMSSYSKVIYIGVTNDLFRRVNEHKLKMNDGFTAKYNIHSLVYFEEYDCPSDAIYREKQLKRWARAKKTKLITQLNPKWKDLSEGWYTKSPRAESRGLKRY